tara:strand:- start:337 stop:600 length:264 start_codon:yes stop_codon:yes gene_type:complete
LNAALGGDWAKFWGVGYQRYSAQWGRVLKPILCRTGRRLSFIRCLFHNWLCWWSGPKKENLEFSSEVEFISHAGMTDLTMLARISIS